LVGHNFRATERAEEEEEEEEEKRVSFARK
jgi:hypothetical protein